MSDSPYDRFFGGQGPQAEWDGEPLLLMTQDCWTDIMAHAPHYNGMIQGPVPLGMDSPVQIFITRIHQPSIDAAAEVLHHHARNACEKWNYPYDRDEWTIMALGPRGCS